MNKIILHIDFNSYFATVEQQANPRLRGKPIGVTGGDRLERTVVGAASVEAKRFGVKTGMSIPEARTLCPQIILVKGDSNKYLECTKRFLNILKDYTPLLEVFSIDEAFLEIPIAGPAGLQPHPTSSLLRSLRALDGAPRLPSPALKSSLAIALDIKSRIRSEVGEWISCSIGISYNKMVAKLAGSLYKPDGLVIIADPEAAMRILDHVELDEICGIGFRIKKRLNNMGIFNFKELRRVPLENLLASFKSYGQILYNFARGIDDREVTPFYEKEEIKSVGHRHTIDHDTDDPEEIKQLFVKLSEMVGKRLRDKKLAGKTISCWFRYGLERSYNPGLLAQIQTGIGFSGDGMQGTTLHTNDGLEIFQIAWKLFLSLWNSSAQGKIRMIGVSVSNLRPLTPANLTLLPEDNRKQLINKTLDAVNTKYGDFTLQRGILLNSTPIRRQPNPFLADRRFKI